MFCEISGPLSHAAYTERSTIVDLLIKIQPCGILKVHNVFKRSKICQKRSKISNAPAWKFDKNIPDLRSRGMNEYILGLCHGQSSVPWCRPSGGLAKGQTI